VDSRPELESDVLGPGHDVGRTAKLSVHSSLGRGARPSRGWDSRFGSIPPGSTEQ
jgi:hypothetical protein